MKKFSLSLSILALFLFAGELSGQITISGGSNVNGPYTTIASAVTALNGATISGPVVMDVNAGHTEVSSSRINLTATGTSVNTITIQKNGGGANPLITAYTGSNLPSSLERDGIFSITGGDWITIDGIDLQENAANTTPTELMEYGYGLFKESGTNGSQHVTIRNSNISLSTLNFEAWAGVGHFGSNAIVVLNCTPTDNAALTVTSVEGANSFNTFESNTLRNCHSGIALVGFVDATPFEFSDYSNIVGGDILANGNTIVNYGGGTGANTAAAGVYSIQQRDLTVSFNTIVNNDGLGINHPNILYGIWAQASVSASATFNNNDLNITGGGTTQVIAAIRNESGATPASNTVNISNNTITAQYLSATTGGLYGIWNSATAANLNMNNNSVSNFSYGSNLTTGTGVLYGIHNSVSNAAMVINANDNTVINFTRIGTTGGTTIGIALTSGVAGMNVSVLNNTVRNLSIDGTGTSSIMYGIQTSTGTIVINNNLVDNLSCLKTTGTGVMYGIFNTASPVNEMYNDNIIRNLLHRGTGITYGLYANTISGTRTVSGNLIHTVRSGGTAVAGIHMITSSPNVFNNKIYDIESTSSGAPVVSGILQGSVGTAGVSNIYNNYIGDLKAPNASSTNANTPSIRGINVTTVVANSTVNISFNTVLLNSQSAGTDFATAGLFVTSSATATTANLNLKNNIIVNNSIPAGVGNAVAYQRSTTSVANYDVSSNNNLFYAGVPGSANLIYFDGTNSDQDINDFKCRVQPRESSSISENPTFLSISGSSNNFLHIDPTFPTGIESGGVNITGITNDYDGDIRQGNPGYTGTGVAPDMGADEGEFILSDLVGPSISYSILGNSICTHPLSIDAEIVDGSGVNNNSGTKPRLWFKKSTENNSLPATNTSSDNGWKWVEATNASTPYNFVFDYTLLTSAVTSGDTIQYFIVAQDLLSTPNVSTLAANYDDCAIPSSVALSADLFPVTGTNSFEILQTPNIIFSQISPTTICIIGDVTLSLDTPNLGAEYQWQSSPAGANNWTDIPNANTESVFVEGVNVSTDFRSVITCNNNPIFASPSEEVSIVVSNPEILTTTPGSECGPGPVSVTLGATANQGAEIRWYEEQTGGLVLGTGETFNTPPISTTTSYYVAASDGGGTANVGLPERLSTATSGGGTTNFGIVFDVLQACILQTVTVYAVASTPGTQGTVTIDVIDENNIVLHTATVAVTGNPTASAIPDVVTLNFNLSPGTNFKLRPSARSAGITGLLFEPAAAAPGGNYGYPFVVPEYISLNHSTLTAAPTNTPRLDLYYYFYDWVIVTGCESARIEVLASIINEDPICPSDTSVCINTAPFTLTGATPIDGEYSGPGVENGIFNPGLAGVGTHIITYTACNLSCTFNITVNPSPSASIIVTDNSGTMNDDGVICLGDSATLTASGGTSYLWSNGESTAAITVSPNTNTTYSVTVTANGCSASTSASITVNPNPSASIMVSDESGTTNDDGIICSGDEATLTATGGTAYIWSNGANTPAITVSPNINVTYFVTVTANGCSAIASSLITVVPLPNAGITGNNNICFGQSTTLTAFGGTAYVWSNGENTPSITVSPSVNTTYTVTVTGSNGCTAIASRTVTVNPNPSASISVSDESGTNNDDGIICSGDQATLTASGGMTYLWSNGETTAAITVSPNTTTSYIVTVYDNGCSGSTSRSITVNPVPSQPTITIINNVCPSLSGSISASECEGNSVLEWALSPTGPWSTTAPDYTSTAFTVYARCNNLTTGCISEISSATTAPVICVMDCAVPSFTSCSSPVVENFTGFGGTGFSTLPSGTQLCANTWAWTGWSDGAMTFGQNRTTGDYARGNTVAGNVSTGGIYSLNNGALYIQPGGSDWAPGTATFRVQNNSGGIIEAIDLAYDILVRNDQARSNSFNFSYSIDDVNYINIPSLDYTSPAAADPAPIVINTVPRSHSLIGLTIADGDFVYFRWSGADAGGSGSRDEFGLDNIIFTPVCNTCPTAAVISGDGTFCEEGNISNIPVVVTITEGEGPFTLVISESGNEFTVNNYELGSPIERPIFESQTYSLVSVNDANGCPVPVNNLSGLATVTEINCGCPLIEVVSITQNCVFERDYELTVCFNATNIQPGDNFHVDIDGQIFGPFLYDNYDTNNLDEYCVTLSGFTESTQTDIPVTIVHLGSNPPSPILDGNVIVDSEWNNPIAMSDDLAGWAGVNVNDLYITSDLEYVYFGANFNNADNWQSWGFAINTVNNAGGSSEVWTHPIIYGHSELPDFVVKGNFGGYSELRVWDGSNWFRSDNNGNDVGLNSNDFSANNAGMVEVRIKKSILNNPASVNVQFYVSGNNSGEHATFDAVPDDEVATSWNHNGQNGNPGPTTLDNYAPAYLVYYPVTCEITSSYNEFDCLDCPEQAPIVMNVSYCVGDTATALTATPRVGGDLVWYNQIPGPGVNPLPSAPTPNTSFPNVTSFWVVESLNGCEGPAAEIIVTVGLIDIVEVSQTCVNPSLYDLRIKFLAYERGTSGLFKVNIDEDAYGPFSYLDYAEGLSNNDTIDITILGAGNTSEINSYFITVKDDGNVPNTSPVIDGTFDGEEIWGTPVSISDGLPGWADANAKKLYITQDDDYVYLGAEIAAPSWQSWAFLLNTQSGGGTFDSWSRSIDYVHANAPDFVFRGTFDGYAELHNWTGTGWAGYSAQPSTEYSANASSWVEVRILKSTLNNPSFVDAQFYITGNNNDHGSFDASPDDDNATSWNESNNRTQLDNYAPTFAVELPNDAMCMAMYLFTETPCGSWIISDPCMCNNDATLAGDDGTFNEEITVTGPAGQIITANCIGCSSAVLSFTEGPAGTYVSQIFTHIDNIGYVAEIFADGVYVADISNKCAYPNVAIDAIGPFSNCRNQSDVDLTAIITGDDGTGDYDWSGTGVTGDMFNPSDLLPDTYVISLDYTGVALGNISIDGGVTAAYPGCLQPDTIQVVIYHSVLPPVIEDITVCEGGNTTIIAGVINPGLGQPVSLTYNFEGDNPASIGSDSLLIDGVPAIIGPGIANLTYPAGCGSVDAMSANTWTQPTEADAVINGDYFEFGISNSSTTNTILIDQFSFSGRISGTGPTNWAIYNGTSPLGFSGVTTAATTPTPCGNYATNAISLTIPPGGNTTIRIYAWGNTAAAGTFRIDDVVIAGSSIEPSNNFKFYLTDPTNGGQTPVAMGSEYDPMTTLLTSPQSVWVTECAPDGCESLPTEVVVTVLENPTLDVPDIDAVCAPNTINVLDIDFAESPTGGTFSFHDTQLDAENNINPITTGLDAVSETRDLYVRYELQNGCFTVALISIEIYPRPTPPNVPSMVSTCDGESPVITIDVSNIPVTFTWDFETNITDNGVSNNTAIASNGPVQTVGSGLTGVGFQPAGSGCSNAITSTGYDISNASLFDAIVDNEYFEFCIGNAEPGMVFAGVNNITWGNRASGTGPMSFALVTSNSPNTILISGVVGGSCTIGGGNIPLNQATCYRIYYWGASNAAGTLRIDNMVITAQYVNDAIYNFYTVDPDTNPNATPIFTGTSYNTNLTVADGPTEYWVNCTNPITGCTSPPVLVVATVFPNPIVTTVNSCIGGGNVNFTASGASGGVWSVNGGGTINPNTGEFTPTTAGCFTATYTAPGDCIDFEEFVVFPATPSAPLISNTCATTIFVPVLQPVPGFTAQYSFNGVWGTNNISPATPGCYSVATRYVLTNTCGRTLAGSTAPAPCTQSLISNAVIFPNSVAAPVVSNTCNTPITIPTIPTVVGFTAQYSFDDGMTWSANNVSPLIPGCYTTRTRYVLSTTCGTTLAGAAGTGTCAQSPSSNAVIFPTAPVISMPVATCMTSFVLPTVPSIPGFNVEYSVNNAAFVPNPMPIVTPGCYNIQARYVLAANCGSTLAGTQGTGGCSVSNTVIANILPVPNVLGQPDILVCNMTEISPLPFTSTVTIPSCINTTIVYNWTNSNTNIGLPASGVGNIPSFIGQNPGEAIITVTPSITFNGVTCVGQPITFRIYIHLSTAMTCNNHVNISLDRNCNAEVFIDFFVEDPNNPVFYEVVYKTSSGYIVPHNQIRNFLGQILYVEVVDICNGNKCWGTVMFEDKYPPIVACEDVTINCLETSRLYLPFNDPNFIGLPTVTENCDNALQYLKYSEIEFGDVCNKTIVRRWATRDDSYNYSNECVQTINVRQITFGEIFIPNLLVEVDCNTNTDPASLAAATGDIRDGYAYIISGNNIIPVDGVVCNIVAAFSDQTINDVCGPHCHGVKKVIRTWQFIDWCEGIVSNPIVQLIKVSDNIPPTFIVKDTIVTTSPWYCAADFDLPLPWDMHDNCDFTPTYKVSGPGIVTISGNPTGNSALTYRATGAPKGVHVFCYTASDCCGNVATQCISVTVIDKTPPVVTTKQNIVLGLVPGGPGQDGNAKLFTHHIDNGSYDNCTNVKLEIRRPAGSPSCNNDGNIIDPITGERYNNNVTFNNNVPRLHADDNVNDTDNGEFVKFCCEDLTTGVDTDGDGEINIGYHEVILRVWDDGDMNGIYGTIGDNYNETWGYVKVEDKAAPVIQCPPNATIHCDWAITLSGDLGAGAQFIDGVDFTKTGLPTAYGTCGALPIRFRDNAQLNQCGIGTVTRDFFVGTAPVNSAPSCRQTITVASSTSGQQWVVTPPSSAKIDVTCDGPTETQIINNKPSWLAGPCDVIGYSYDVEEFLFEDGVCKKWRVTYNLMNWCTDEARGPYFKDFVYRDLVDPVIENCDPLMFGVDVNCEHRLVLTNRATDTGGCIETGWLKWQVFIDLWADGTNDWEFSSFLPVGNDVANAANGNLAAIQDNNNNGVPDIYVAPTINGGTISITIPEIIVGKMSNHKVVWKVTDGCHNYKTCHQDVMVVDKKAPTPYCLHLSTALMEDPDGDGPLRPMVELWAIDFNVASVDNCTPQADLLYTFDNWAPQVEDKVVAGRLMNIDLPHYFNATGGVMAYPTTNAGILNQYNNGELQLWIPSQKSSAKVWTSAVLPAGENKAIVDVMMSVWDKKFNVDFCWVTLTIVCNSCENEDGSKVTGMVATDAGQGVENVLVSLGINLPEYPKTTLTNEMGMYSLDFAHSGAFHISAQKDYDYMNGVSTFDLVLIQRHILGLQEFTNPYQIIAADVNNNGKIDPSDLVELRRLILGIDTKFTNESWRFPIVSQTMNLDNLFPYVDTIFTNLIDTISSNNQNFVAVKIGDVNGNATTDVQNPATESRTASRIDLIAAEQSVAAGETVEVEVKSSNFKEVFGYQFTMNLNGANFVDVKAGAIDVTADNVGVLASDMITMSFASLEAATVSEDATLFTIVLRANKAGQLSEMMNINSNVTRAESYAGAGMKVNGIALTVGSKDAVAQIELFQNEPNPFKGITKVNFNMPKADQAVLTVYDVTGRVVAVRNINAVQGMNTETFSSDQLSATGVLYYKLESGDFTASKKMIIIE